MLHNEDFSRFFPKKMGEVSTSRRDFTGENIFKSAPKMNVWVTQDRHFKGGRQRNEVGGKSMNTFMLYASSE